jgi:hypothetical protein
MIPKLILSNSYDFGDPAVSLVPLHRKGVDDAWMAKHASSGVFHDVLRSLKPIPGQSIIHVIAVGDEEMWGPNRNADAFSREDNRTRHNTFVDHGKVYKHHQSDDPLKAVGDLIRSAHSEEMSRIELLMGLDNDKCSTELSKLDDGGDLPVSMGSWQQYDVCSVCKHKAPTVEDHCDHIKNFLGCVLNDGRRIYMQNPKPTYYDISLVFRPADRVAYTLRKVAAEQGRVLGGHELAQMLGLSHWASPKIATIRTLAAIAKDIPVTLRKATAPSKLPGPALHTLTKAAQAYGPEHVFHALTSVGCLLHPYDFAAVVGYRDPSACETAIPKYAAELRDLLTDCMDITSFDPPQSPERVSLTKVGHDLSRAASMLPDDVNARVLRRSILPESLAKVAGELPEDEACGLALLYGQYKVAFATAHRDQLSVLRAVAATF